MNGKKLYIIGNGFDLHHRYKSGFCDYGRWLKEKHEDIYNSLESEWFNIPDEDEDSNYEWRNWWSNFENNIGEISLRRYIENTADIAFFEAADAEERRAHHIYAGERIANSDFLRLANQINGTFKEWIQTLHPGVEFKKLPIEAENAFFINFNYTPTLEKTYQISKDSIFYVHGSIDSEEYILGHGKSYVEIAEMAESDSECPTDIPIEEMAQWYNAHTDDYMTDQVKQKAIEQLYGLRKNVEQIIENNKEIFKGFESVEQINIYGFSFSNIDIPYLFEIISHINLNKVKWEISYFCDTDNANIDRFIRSANIPPRMVTKIRLTDIQIDPQLEFDFESTPQ